MKTKISHLCRSSVSVILAVMMLLSTMLIGTISTANAVVSGLSAIYFTPSENWAKDNANFRLNVQDNNDKWHNIKMTKIDASVPIYRGEIEPDTSYKVIQFLRYNANDNGELNYSRARSDIPEGKNYYKMTTGSLNDWTIDDANGEWSTYPATDSVQYYICGRFNKKWHEPSTDDPSTSDPQFVEDESNPGLFYYKTGETIAQLSGTIEENYDNTPKGYPRYFYIYKKATNESTKYLTSGNDAGHTFQKNTDNNKLVLMSNDSTDEQYLIRFYDVNDTSTAPVTIWLDTTTSNEYKLWYTTAPTTTYTVNYGVNGGNGTLTATGVTASGSAVNSGTKVTFTAKPSEGYAVEGWYSDANCQNAITVAGTNTSYEVTVNAKTDVYVKFKSTTIESEYKLMGTLFNGWGSDNAISFDKVDGSYSKEITVKNDDLNNKYFKLIDGKGKNYGPDNGNVDICGYNNKSDSYDTFENYENSFIFSKAGTYKIYYTVKTGKVTPSVWVEEITTKYYTVTVPTDVSATVDKKTAAADETVTVTVTPETGKVLESVTVEGADGSTIETAVSGNTATFTMPSQNVIVTGVNFRTAEKYTVTFSSSNETYGKVTAEHNGAAFATGNKVTEGDTVTFTANPNEGYTFTGWTVNDVLVSPTANPYTITVNKNTTVVANFKEETGTPSGYYLLCGEDPTFKVTSEGSSYKSVPLYTNEEGVYYADFDAADITKNKEYFIIFSRKEDTSGIIVETNNVTINTVDKNGFSLGSRNDNVLQPNGGSNNVRFAKVYINSDDVIGFTIKITGLDISSKKITYSAEPKIKEAPKNAVNIIAKNGTQTAKFQSMGTTAITPVENVVFDIENYNAYTKKATAIKGNKVTVTTTVADDYKDTYYVKGFVVNGESYGIQSGPNETGVYTLEYQIPDDVADKTDFEITPVYFLKDSSNCVTFYVEGFDGDIQKSWGNTIACYPYYEGVDNTNNNAFGAYPGQPLLYEGGKYYTQIPKSITLDGADKKIVGMTLNNFALESVHNAISPIKDNKQSYDYDDFVRIANNNYGNNIIFTFKYSTAKDNFDSNINSPETINKADFDSTSGNGWEDLTDYKHRKVDLFGNVLTGADSEKEPLLVVSNGYFENYQGFYATEWTVYKKLEDGTYSKITQIPSSALLLKSKNDLINSTSDGKYKNSLASYADAYETLEAYKNTPAQITFESSIKRGFSLQGGTNGDKNGSGELAERVDGRWYYSMMGEEITAKIAVEYGDTATSTFKNDPFVDGTNGTTTIGAHAYFTNEGADGKTTYKSNIDSSKYFTFTADTITTDGEGQNYVFLGWYLLSDNKYTKLTDAKAPMTGSDTFVARYVKAPAGTVTIDHRLFSVASNPTPTQTPGTGSGKCYVTVEVLDENGKVIETFAETENSVTLDKTYIDATKNYTLKITLRTVTSGQDKFDKFYFLAQNKQDYVSIDPDTTNDNVTTVIRTVNIRNSFFTYDETNGTYTFKNTTGSDSIHYYSDIKETKIPYKITFNYVPRLASDAKQYVVTGYFTSEYILNHGAELTNDFVMSVAPYEDNFFNTIKWDNDNITINNGGETKTAEVTSTTSLRTVTVKALNVDGSQIKAYELNGVSEFTSTVVYGNLLRYDNLCGLTDDEKAEIAGDKEYIYVANPEYNGQKFSYWQISTSSDMNDTSAYVTKCFSREFNYIAYNNYYIWPVYGESQLITGASTTLNFLDYSRNQSTDSEGNNKTDRVFADFALAFDSNGIQLKTYTGDNIKVGMFLEVCGDLESDSNGNVITDINYYKDKPEYSTSDTDLESIKTAILANSANKSLSYTTADGKERKLLNKPIELKLLDNKNRIEYYVGYNNNDNNQKKLMRAYSYVIVDGKITLCSTCYSFVNYYNVGNKTYTVS